MIIVIFVKRHGRWQYHAYFKDAKVADKELEFLKSQNIKYQIKHLAKFDHDVIADIESHLNQ